MVDRSQTAQPGVSRSGWDAPVDLDALWRRIEARMGVCPSFFRLARHEPPIASGLFSMAELAYLDSPIPARFKEQLFTYLSRFCPVSYCVARHCAFLLGRGTIAGDAGVERLSLDEVRRLLAEPLPVTEELPAVLTELERAPPMDAWPEWDTADGHRLRVACAQVFLHTHRASRWSFALQRVLGRARHEQIALLLGFVRLAHFWTEVHPELETDDDVERLLAEHRELSALIEAREASAAPSEAPAWLLEEIDDLRDRAEGARKLRQLASSLPAYVAHVDPQGRYTFVNETYAAGFEVPADELVGRSVREVLGDESYAAVAPHLDAALRGEHVRFDGRIRIPRDGERFLEVTYLPDRRPDGSVAGCFVLAIDLTERKRTEQRLRESDQRKDAFLALLGHELRSPLAAIRHASEILGHMSAREPQLARIHGVLDRQASHMTRLIEGLLEVSRIALGKVHLERKQLDLRAIVEAVVADRRASLDAGGLALQLTVPPERVDVFGDEVRLTQVLDNLLGNAIKFTDRGGAIVVALRVHGSVAELVVRDSGAGISAGRLESIFEPFEQDTHGLPRAAGGLGLGLPLVRALVGLHEGRVEARSDGPGTGSEFEVRLPLARVSPRDPAARSLAPTHSVAPQRILVVEDNPDAAEMLRDLLRLRGHEVVVAETVAGALEVLRASTFRVVICDIGLPGTSGHELARRVRADPGLRTTALIALTGFGQAEDRERTREAGFDAHLVKPVSIETLDDTLCALLG